MFVLRPFTGPYILDYITVRVRNKLQAIVYLEYKHIMSHKELNRGTIKSSWVSKLIKFTFINIVF